MLRILLVLVTSLFLVVSVSAQSTSPPQSTEQLQIQALDWEYRYCIERMKSIQAEYKEIMESKRKTSEKDRKALEAPGIPTDSQERKP